jgi:hypothetical protein
MKALRPYLCWLLAALLVGLGVPTRASAPCADAQDAQGCCARTTCCCATEANVVCDCGVPEPEPAPAPSPSQKQPLQRCEPEPVAVPHRAVHARVSHPPVAALRRPAGLLPSRSRQEALSVWRC